MCFDLNGTHIEHILRNLHGLEIFGHPVEPQHVRPCYVGSFVLSPGQSVTIKARSVHRVIDREP